MKPEMLLSHGGSKLLRKVYFEDCFTSFEDGFKMQNIYDSVKWW